MPTFPKRIIKEGIALEDRYFDLKALSVYSCLSVSSLRGHIKRHGLPCYTVRNEKGQTTKVLVRMSEFDRWMRRWKNDDTVTKIVDSVMEEFRDDT